MSAGRLLMGSGTLAAAMATARAGVPEWDASLFRRLNALPDVLAPIVWGPMQAGALGAPLAVGAVLLASGHTRVGMRTAATGAVAWAAAKAVKRSVARGRPGDHIDGTRLRMGSADHGLGFPSGHAAVVVTLVSGIPSSAHPAWKAAGVLLAATVGVSRIYVGAHYPLDVIGGWALGATIADCARIAEASVVLR
jgi:membrane-associated phospholipid phosphatase